MNKVLVIAPHADDEVLGCGATIAKHVANGDQVFIIIATNASIEDPILFTKKILDQVRNEALVAHKILGVKDTYFLDFPAPALNAFPEYKISIELSKLFKDIKPNILYIPHPGDIHQDHKAIYRAALVSSRPQADYTIKSIYCYETLSETEWTPMNESYFKPNFFVDVSKCFKKKIEAMKCFESQLKEFPHSRSLEALDALATYRGSIFGVSRAEAFTVERIIQ